MRARPGSLTYLLASAILGASALLAMYAAWRVAPTSPAAVYTLTPLSASGRVHVLLELSHLPPGRFVLVAPEGSGPEGVESPVPDFGDQQGEPMAARLWWGMSKNGTLRVSYEVEPEHGDDRHALLYGARTFAIPLGADRRDALFDPDIDDASPIDGAARHIEVRFELPPGWDAYTPWSESAPRVTIEGGRFARLRESVVALGDYVPHELPGPGAAVQLVTRGTDPMREERLADLVRRTLHAHADAIGALPHRRALVVADHQFRGDQAVGQTVGNAVHLTLSKDLEAFESRSLPRVVSHEMFHLWNGGAVDLDAPELRWFAEGVTDYYGLRALARIGRLTPDELGQDLAAYLDRLRGNPWADSSFAALGRGYPKSPLAWSATYSKGALAAWALDLRLAPRGGLDPLVARVVRGGVRPDLAAELGAEGEHAAALAESLSGPRYEAALARELARHDLRLSRGPSRQMTLGMRFFRPGTTEVVDLEPDGPAARFGVRRGDRVVEVNGKPIDDLAVLSQALFDSPGGAVRLRIERGRRRFDVSVVPVRAVTTRLIGPVGATMATRLPAPGELPPAGAGR
jgi:predicted metalloprotease with PDZ domain